MNIYDFETFYSSICTSCWNDPSFRGLTKKTDLFIKKLFYFGSNSTNYTISAKQTNSSGNNIKPYKIWASYKYKKIVNLIFSKFEINKTDYTYVLW